ncbi:uncharacterized protein K452DRAFT_302032 [Aplosporella prunicola CBS 121167]|uniref:Uncharacterized protein n=1 Tax=Aplosporella prunicola CBS 121167 TaxID=1176127 RepID=A0A6A6AZA2_9PEZI|nr:uncharacterized protein K452DRAFT_302032 [Aplosporella prunicola CBS 121167]KAF2137272.1 hypothetical protein K452DRAFT_302032 [Aplosporella prunicola CBS 121167]
MTKAIDSGAAVYSQLPPTAAATTPGPTTCSASQPLNVKGGMTNLLGKTRRRFQKLPCLPFGKRKPRISWKNSTQALNTILSGNPVVVREIIVQAAAGLAGFVAKAVCTTLDKSIARFTPTPTWELAFGHPTMALSFASIALEQARTFETDNTAQCSEAKLDEA